MADGDPSLANCVPSTSGSFGADGPDVKASLCEISLKLPSFSLPSFKLPKFDFALPFPIPKFALKLSCDPKKPIDISAGLEWGGGRIGCYEKPKVE